MAELMVNEFHPSSDKFQIFDLIKSDSLVKVELVDDDNNYTEVKVEGKTSFDLRYFDHNGTELYAWMYEKVVITSSYESTIEIGKLIVYNEPTDLTRKDINLPDGLYLCKTLSVRDMKTSTQIMNLHKNCSSIGGSFLFDMVRNHKLLSACRIS